MDTLTNPREDLTDELAKRTPAISGRWVRVIATVFLICCVADWARQIFPHQNWSYWIGLAIGILLGYFSTYIFPPRAKIKFLYTLYSLEALGILVATIFHISGFEVRFFGWPH